MKITLYNVPESRAHISKTLGTGAAYQGQVRGEIDMVSPIVAVAATITQRYNYAYIDEYAGYYWVKEITVERTGLSVVQLQRDPLTTFAAGVRACPALAHRTATPGKNTLYIPDSLIKMNQYTFDETLTGSGIFSYNGNFILITTG